MRAYRRITRLNGLLTVAPPTVAFTEPARRLPAAARGIGQRHRAVPETYRATVATRRVRPIAALQRTVAERGGASPRRSGSRTSSGRPREAASVAVHRRPRGQAAQVRHVERAAARVEPHRRHGPLLHHGPERRRPLSDHGLARRRATCRLPVGAKRAGGDRFVITPAPLSRVTPRPRLQPPLRARRVRSRARAHARCCPLPRRRGPCPRSEQRR